MSHSGRKQTNFSILRLSNSQLIKNNQDYRDNPRIFEFLRFVCFAEWKADDI